MGDEAKQCKFWRYEYNHDTKKTECSLQTGCGEYTVGDCQDQSYCNSGQLGCYADGTPISSCELTGPTDYVNNEFHIICTDEDEGDINLYSEDVKIVPGDQCATQSECVLHGMNKMITNNPTIAELPSNATADQKMDGFRYLIPVAKQPVIR